jgi:pimeloyl-ACP methyl ester carboxylesterase
LTFKEVLEKTTLLSRKVSPQKVTETDNKISLFPNLSKRENEETIKVRLFQKFVPWNLMTTRPDSPAEPWHHRRAIINHLHFHYVEAGSGPLVILLHGFPEFWYSWRHQIPVLASAGFQVVAPDLRGYNESAKPPHIRDYRLDYLLHDVIGLIHHCGATKATVVGHDWGGVIAWALAMYYPNMVDRLVILNAPHPSAFRRELKKPRQWLRSWYIFFFQLPWLPEWNMRARTYRLLDRMLLQQPVRPNAFTAEDIHLYKTALDQPGACTAAINYYRAAFRYPDPRWQSLPRITVPTLLIWGEQDHYLGIRLTQDLEPWIENLRVERLPNASHWVQNDAPERVNQLLLEFLASVPQP